jgi:hypothetical protein
MLALSKGHKSPSPYLKTETDPVSETLGYLLFRILDDEQSPQTQSFSVSARGLLEMAVNAVKEIGFLKVFQISYNGG